MNYRRSWIRVGAAALAVCVVALAAFAGPAMAEYQRAKFDKSGMVLSTTGLTLERAGGSAKTCTPKSTISGSVTEGSFAILSNFFAGLTRFNCSGSTELEMALTVEAQRDSVTGATRVLVGNGGSTYGSPWGTYSPHSFFASYTNGTGAATPSKITFSKTEIGTDGVGSLTLTGVFNVMYNSTETVKIVP